MITIHTQARSHRVPLTQARRRLGPYDYKAVAHLTMTEYDAILDYLRGEEEGYTLQVVRAVDKMCCESVEYKYGERGPCSLPLPLQRAVHLTNPSFVTLRSNDGAEFPLRRSRTSHFTLLADYFEEYPDETSIDIPHPGTVLKDALGPIHSKVSSLSSCLDCVRLLNPSGNTYFLEFNLEGIDPQVLKDISLTFTGEERKELKRIYRSEGYSYPLPDDGEGYCILAACENVRQYSRIGSLFSDYPGWLFSHLVYGWHPEEVYYDVLLKADFTRDEGEARSHLRKSILHLIVSALKHKKNLVWEEAGKLLAMIGIISPYLFNDTLDVCPPYGMRLYAENLTDEGLEARLKAIYPGKWNEERWRELHHRAMAPM